MTNRPKILFAEDNPDLASMLKMYFERNAFFDFDMEKTGESTAALYHAAVRDGKPYDLLFFDVAMPMKLGTTILEEIRSTGDETPAILFTGLPPREVRDAAQKLKARVIFKPADVDEILGVIAEALNGDKGT